jgi:hypothetical protein
MNIRSIAVALFLLCTLFSCTSYRFLDIEALKPAELTNPYKAKKFYILNLKKIAIESDMLKDSVFLRIFYLNLGYELQKKLKESPIFANTEILNTSIAKMKEEYITLDFEQRKFVNACFIKSITISDTLVKHYDNSGRWWNRYEMIYKIVYYFDNLASIPNVQKEIMVCDTITCDGPSNTYYSGTDLFQMNKTILYSKLSDKAAELFAHKVAPYWIKVERLLYYRSNKNMRKAYDYFVEDKITDAIQQWQIVYDNGTKSLASMAAHNIALSYEVLDSLSLANEWINKSVALKPNPDSKLYQSVLAQRLSDSFILNSQLKQTQKMKQLN